MTAVRTGRRGCSHAPGRLGPSRAPSSAVRRDQRAGGGWVWHLGGAISGWQHRAHRSAVLTSTRRRGWTFVRSGSSWGQRGSKIVVNTVAGNEQGQGEFGSAVGLSGDGIRALIGAPNDNNIFGAVWAFNQVPSCAGQAASAPPGGGSVTIALSCVGPVGQPITYAIAAGPSHGASAPSTRPPARSPMCRSPASPGATRSRTWPPMPAGPHNPRP